MGIVMGINVAVVILNTVLLSALLWLYGGMLRQMPTRFTWGLLLFAGALWLQAVAQLFFYATMMSFYVDEVQPLILAQNVLATLASLTLLSVTVMPTGRTHAAEA